MAVLIEERVDQNIANTRHELLEWHSKSGRLAVSSYNPNIGGEVNFFTHHGGKSEIVPVRKANARVTQLKWHPDDDIIAVAWDSGDVVLRTVDESNEFLLPVDDDPLGEISCLLWNSSGSLIFIADKNGIITLNKIDHKKLRQSKQLEKVNIAESANCALHNKLESKSISVKNEKNSLGGEQNVPDETVVDSLDAFTNDVKAKQQDNHTIKSLDGGLVSFIIGGGNGGLYLYIETSGVHKVFQVENAIVEVMQIESKSLILALAQDMMLYQIKLIPNGKAEEKIRVKLNGKWPNFQIIMTEEGILAMCSSEKDVRVWDLNTEDTGVISLQTSKGFSAGDTLTCLSYSPRKGCLSGGTSDGKVATWKRRVANTDESIDGDWKLQEAVEVGSQVIAIRWAISSNSLAVSTGFSVTILKEQPILSHMSNSLVAVQTGNMSLLLIRLKPTEQQEVQLTFAVKGVFVGEKNIAVWDHEQVTIYELIDSTHSPLKTQVLSSFACMVSAVAIFQQNLYCLEPEKVNVRTMQGTVKQILSIPEMEGDPLLMDLRSSWLCIATSNGFLRIYDLSRREAKQQYQSKYVVESIDNFNRFVMIKLNKDGNRVSFTCTTGDSKEVHSYLTVWDAESDTIAYFDFSTGMTDQQQYEAEADAALAVGQRPATAAVRKIEKEQMRYRMLEHSPGVHCWDSEDPRFLICEANHRNPDVGPNYLLSMFVTSEYGLQMQDLQPRSLRSESLLAMAVPYLYFIKKTDNDDEDTEYEKSLGRLLLRRVLREFIGLEDSEKSTKEAMLNFSLYLTVGRMDEAFNAIKFIESESVWEHMARMCVKTRRLDVALVCLGNMGNASGARALRKAMKSGAPQEVQVAILAIQLGLLEEARSLFASCGRHDLVNRLLQSQNQWNLAFEIAEHNDRIHLRNTYFSYAKYLESLGVVEGAIDNYEKSDTQRFEVPRMLFDDPKVLEAYVKKRRDQNLQRWWAQYLESIGDLSGAKGFYQASKDYLSVIRLLCYKGLIDEATEIANKTADKAACYHLARFFENDGDVNSAVHFFTKAHAYSSAIRLAKEHNMKEKLANLALMAGGSDLVEAARYYEELPGQADKAVMLYHKAGMIGRALDLAFRTEQFSALDLIAKDLDERSDPRVLERAAEFFINNQQYEKAVQFLAYAKNYVGAIDLCRKKNVPVTEQLAEILTPSKESIPNAIERNELLEKIADCCVQQRNYHFAAKKYTQAGNMLQAMRSLLKSGDTEKIIFFAKKARNKEIYILAANFLQTLNWKTDANLMRHIETFYTKANAYEHLASFYEACAQVEIDDYRDYSKANAALVEAQRCIKKALEGEPKNVIQLSEKLDELSHTIANIKKFVGIRTIYETDPNDAIRQLQTLADEKGIEESIRIGDIYAVMIIHNARKSNFKKAYSLICQLQGRQPRIDVSRYVNAQILDTICDELHQPRLTDINSGAFDEEDDAEEGVEYSHALKRQIQSKSSSFAESDLHKALNS